jgi:hypothetical protein
VVEFKLDTGAPERGQVETIVVGAAEIRDARLGSPAKKLIGWAA